MTIAINNLTHHYGTLCALDAITATAQPGKVTALIGPNASGKSTLLRCVIGALKPATGAIAIKGEPVVSLSPSQLAARLAYVPQRSDCAARFTVRQIVELGRYALAANRARIDAALDDMHIADLADRPLATLSVGQQQRVTLARALAQAPDDGVLILDEPTAAMDLQHARHAARLLNTKAAGGMTILVAIHDITLAAAIAEDVWLLNAGRLAAAGSVGEVMTPETLEAVFGVAFINATDREGGSYLVPAHS